MLYFLMMVLKMNSNFNIKLIYLFSWDGYKLSGDNNYKSLLLDIIKKSIENYYCLQVKFDFSPQYAYMIE